MEFRLRATENIPASSYLSTATTDGYFTTQALRAGYIGTIRSAVDIRARESLQREIDKERIREEIIAGESLRKRVLEEEVRRELAMERELALQQRPSGMDRFPWMAVSVVSEPRGFPGVRVGERLGLQGRSEVRIVEKFPFQRHSGATAGGVGTSEVKLLPPPATAFEGSKGGPVVFLGKSPKSNLVSLKRNASDAATTVNENPWLVKPKKVAKEWNCALCQVSATSEEGLNDHLQGKKHKSKAGQLKVNKTMAKTNAKQTKKQDEKKQLLVGTAKQVALKHKTDGVKKRKFAFWCIHCKIGCHSGTVMAAHCRGKKHKALLQRLEGSGTTASIETHGKAQVVNVGVAEEVKGETEETVDGEVDGEVDGVEEMAPEAEEEAAEAAVEQDCTEE